MGDELPYSTEHYKVVIYTRDEMSSYRVINREFGVTEYEDYLLSRIIETVAEMEKKLVTVLQQAAVPALTSVATIVRDEEDGEDSLH